MLDWVQRLQESGELEYIKYAQEVGEGPEPKPHLQGYLYLTKKRRFNSVKNSISSRGGAEVHLSLMRGTIAQNDEYVGKEGGPIYEWGNKPEQRGAGRPSKRKAEVFLELLNEGMSVFDIVNKEPSALYHMKHLKEYAAEKRRRTVPAWREMTVYCFWGPTGTNKTRTAMSSKEETFLMNPSKFEWWDGYQGQPIVVLDEYLEQWPLTRLLKVLDGYPLELPVKGSFEPAMYTTVILTSNQPPKSWYIGWNEASRAALLRRISAVYQFESCCMLKEDMTPVKMAWDSKALNVEPVFQSLCRVHRPPHPPDQPPASEHACSDEDCDGIHMHEI